jgi:hypothetical protein
MAQRQVHSRGRWRPSIRAPRADPVPRRARRLRAIDQYNLCAPARGESRKAAYTAIEDSLSTKAELVPALNAAFAYCDAGYGALTDASGSEPSLGNRNRFSMLNWNLWHTWVHYGNIVVYLRMKGLVPPSSEKSQTAPIK